jgi:predicted O-methyltransferase YrrM
MNFLNLKAQHKESSDNGVGQKKEFFSLNEDLLRDVFQFAKPFGHNENSKKLNLGFGFIYYGVVRALKPKHIVVIGSGYGYSVVCLALGLKDNGKGMLTFIDPAYSLIKDGPLHTIGGRGMWSDADQVQRHFQRFGLETIVTHHRRRSDEFFPAYPSFNLPPIDLAFIDGSHAFKDVKYDFLQVLEQSHKNTYIFLHDTNIYIRELIKHAGVKKWLNFLKKQEDHFELINFPFSSGVALVRVKDATFGKKLP